MEFLAIKKNKGIYFDPDYEPEKLNLSGALALFQPTFEDLEELKNDLVENMQWSITTIKKEHPIGLTQDEFDAWYLNEFGIGHKRMPESTYIVFMEIRADLQKMMIEAALEHPKRAIKRIIQRQQHMMNPAKLQGGVTEAQIEEAREHPLADLIDKRIFKATGKWTGNCHCPLPGHEGEKTPSFYIAKDNRYKCFGCGGAGDTIEFVMQRDGVDFIRAVKSLIK